MSIEMNRTATEHAPASLRNNNISLNRAELMAGLKAGIGAAYVMGIVALVVSWIHNWGVWMPFNDVSGSLIPALAAGTSFNPLAIIVALVVHFSVALALSVGFVALYSGPLKLTFIPGLPVSVGMVYGLFTWILARFIVLPVLGSEIYAEPAFLVAHLIFGATLGLLYPLLSARQRRRFTHRDW